MKTANPVNKSTFSREDFADWMASQVIRSITQQRHDAEAQTSKIKSYIYFMCEKKYRQVSPLIKTVAEIGYFLLPKNHSSNKSRIRMLLQDPSVIEALGCNKVMGAGIKDSCVMWK